MKTISTLCVCILMVPVFGDRDHTPDSQVANSFQDQQSDSIKELVTKATEAWSAGRYPEAF